MTPKPWKHLPHESGMRWLPPRLNLPFQQKNQNENERRSVIALVYCAELLVPPKRKKETAGLLHLPHNEAHSQNIWRGNWAMNYFASEPLNDTDSDVVIYYPPPFAAIYPRNDNLTEKYSCFMRSEKSYVLKATCFFFLTNCERVGLQKVRCDIVIFHCVKVTLQSLTCAHRHSLKRRK